MTTPLNNALSDIAKAAIAKGKFDRRFARLAYLARWSVYPVNLQLFDKCAARDLDRTLADPTFRFPTPEYERSNP